MFLCSRALVALDLMWVLCALSSRSGEVAKYTTRGSGNTDITFHIQKREIKKNLAISMIPPSKLVNIPTVDVRPHRLLANLSKVTAGVPRSASQRPVAPATTVLARSSGEGSAWVGRERRRQNNTATKKLTVQARLHQPNLGKQPCHGRQPRMLLHRPENGAGKDGV